MTWNSRYETPNVISACFRKQVELCYESHEVPFTRTHMNVLVYVWEIPRSLFTEKFLLER